MFWLGSTVISTTPYGHSFYWLEYSSIYAGIELHFHAELERLKILRDQEEAAWVVKCRQRFG